MHRLYSGGLLLALVFSTAHTPTFQLHRDARLGTDSKPHTASLIVPGVSENPSAPHWIPIDIGSISPPDVWSAAALQRDFAENDAIKRFMLDDFALPTLDVALPALFDWSDPRSEYFAGNRWLDATTYALDHTLAASFPVSGFLGSGGRGSYGGGGMSAPSSAGRANADGAPPDSTTGGGSGEEASTPNTETGGGGTEPGAGGGESDDGSTDSSGGGSDSAPGSQPNPGGQNPGTLPPDYGDWNPPSEPFPPIVEVPTVQVPAPGSLGLFALGLVGLCVANRRKKPKRLAAK